MVVVVVVGMEEEMEEKMVMEMVVEKVKRMAGQGGTMAAGLGYCSSPLVGWKRKEERKMKREKKGVYICNGDGILQVCH